MGKKLDLGKMIRVPLRKAWEHEASDFTPWLAQEENLAELAEAIGLSELELVATEHPIGDFKLDILCTDGDDQVIIENQLEETNHRHLGQLLAYAAGAGARKVIWVCERVRPEHAAALAFLNEHTTEELVFFGVQVELWRIGDSPLAPKFEVVVKPDDWSRNSRQGVEAAKHSSPTKQLQLRFWTGLVQALSEKAPTIRPHRPGLHHWLSISIGKSGFSLQAVVNTRDQWICVQIWISREDSKEQYAALQSSQAQIEQELGFDLDWQEMPDARACRIASYQHDVVLEDESRWPEYFSWLVPRIVIMDRVLRPLIKALP